MLKRKSKSIKNQKKSKSGIESEGEDVTPPEGQHWAEAILDWGLHNDGTMMYLVKWWGYQESDNSWEFQQNVGQCSELLFNFHTTRVSGRYPPKWTFEEFHKLFQSIEDLLQNQDLAVLRKISKIKYNCFEIKDKAIVERIKVSLRSQLDSVSKKFKKFEKKTNKQRLEAIEIIKDLTKDLKIDKNFGSITQFFNFMDRRRVVTKELNKWEKQINQIIEKDSEGKHIKVVNDVDLEKPIIDGYITQYIIDVQFSDEIKLKREKPLIGCECNDCYKCRDECCTAVIGFPMVYDSKGVLNSKQLESIVYECNDKCKCSQNCPNRQIQRGRPFELEIFRTDSKSRGWGVRTLEVIPQGSFITQYTGEVISLIEAEKRPTTYLFDLSAHLDSRDKEFTYVVDASRYGNVTRFVNHSCSPNCRILFAWINQSSNQLLPSIALFAEKHIEINEELTYDYSMESMDFFSQNDRLIKHQFSNSADLSKRRSTNRRFDRRIERVECQCGSNECRNFLYS